MTSTFVGVSTRLLLWSMLPLALALCADFYLIARIIVPGPLAPALSVMIFAVFFLLWFVLPRAKGLQRLIARR